MKLEISLDLEEVSFGNLSKDMVEHKNAVYAVFDSENNMALVRLRKIIPSPIFCFDSLTTPSREILNFYSPEQGYKVFRVNNYEKIKKKLKK